MGGFLWGPKDDAKRTLIFREVDRSEGEKKLICDNLNQEMTNVIMEDMEEVIT